MPAVEIDPADGGRVMIYVSHLEADLMQVLPGSRHDRKRSKPEQTIYTAPLSWGSCVALRGLFPDSLEIGPELTTWATQQRSVRIDPCLQLRQQLDCPGKFDDRLRSFQRAGVAFLGIAERAILGDDMGTGKTVQLIMTLRWLAEYGHQVFPVCVITTASTKIPWRDHFLNWWPYALPIVIDGTPAVRRKQFERMSKHVEAGDPVVCIINIDAVRLHSRLAPYGNYSLKKCRACGGAKDDVSISQCERHEKELNQTAWRSVIVDECHKMADPKSKWTRAIWAIQHQETVRYCYGASGTIGEDPGRLWAPLHGVAPDDFPTRPAYVNRYCLQTWTTFGEWKIIGLQPATKTEFERIFHTRFRRIPIQLAAPLLPAVVSSVREAPMGTAQAKAYKEMKENGHFLGTTVDDSIITSRSMEKETRLLQLSAGMCVMENGKVKITKPSSKMDVFKEVLEELGDRQFIVCGIHRDLMTLAGQMLDDPKIAITYRLLMGGMSAIEKEANRQDFQQGRVQALVFTMGAGGEGLDMTAAGTMIRLQRSWSLIQNLQTERRFWRIGSERHDSLNLVDIVVPGTTEVRQLRVVKQKLGRLEQINQDMATIMANGGLDQARLNALQAEQQAIMTADDLSEEGRDDDDAGL
jgi:SNF2 family DNA or RNA helicase